MALDIEQPEPEAGLILLIILKPAIIQLGAKEIGFDNVPVDGSTNIDDALMESIEPFDISEAVDFKTAYLNGYLADKYDISVEDMKIRLIRELEIVLKQI